jgi:DNA polymerase-1
VSRRPRGGAGSLFLIDANNFVFRAYHGLPMLNAPDGTPVNAVHGYVRMVQAIRKEFAPEYLLAVFDAEGAKARRREIFPAYKANRPPAPDDLIPQLPLVREATDALGVPRAEALGYEADDLIAAYVEAGRRRGLEVVIVSSDKDLMQLVRNDSDGRPAVALWDTMKLRLSGPREVEEKFGVGPDRLGDLLALAGDSSDNIPGVPGIGPKTAASLLVEHGTLEGVLAAAPTIAQAKRREQLIAHAQDARIGRELVKLRDDAPLPLEWEQVRDRGPAREAMEAFFGPLGFKSTLASAPTGGSVPAARRGAAIAPDQGGLEPARGVSIDPSRARIFLAGDRDAWREYAVRLGRVPFAVQVEPTSDDAMRARIVGLSIAPGDPALLPAYVPLGHRTLAEPPGFQLEWGEVAAALGPALADPALPKVCHGHKAAGLLLERHGMRLRGVTMDPMLASYTLDPARTGHELPELARDVLGHACLPLDRVVGKGRTRVGFDQVSVADATGYASERAQVAWALGGHLRRLLDQAGPKVTHLFDEIEMPLARVLARLEQRGILVDPAVFARQSAALGAELAALGETIAREAGHPVNPESPTQLQKLLFEERGLPAKKKTKTGHSVDAQVLEELSLLDPIVNPILEYRSLAKLKGTYLDALPALVHPTTGRVHTEFRQAVAQTGRLSSRDPNLQNIPVRSEVGRRIREGFVAPPGMVLVSLDYSQIELRILAHLSRDPSLTSAFLDGADVHRRTAAEVFGVDEDLVTADQRNIAKAVNFGVIYGQGAFGLARQLGIPQGRAGKYIKAYFERIPGVDAYMHELIAAAKRNGWAETIFGRRRRIPELAARGAAQAYGERIARNTPIQGSAADILKIAMIEVERRLEGVTHARMLLTVHDELIFECDEDHVEDLVELARPAMEGAAQLSVPLVVEAGWGENWARAKA